MTHLHPHDAPLLFDRVAGVATVTLNRPARRNALDQQLREALTEAVIQIKRDRSVKVVVLKGAGGAFCAGGDIQTMQQDTDAAAAHGRMVALHIPYEDLLTMDRPVIAVVDGPAYGAGFGLALTADVILASPRASFCLSFLRLGAVPDSAVFYTLPRIVGVQRAKALAFSTRPFGAEEARDMGIVAEVVEEETIDARAQHIADSLARLPLSVLGMTKRAFNASLQSSLTTMLELEACAQGVARSSEYHQACVQRFLDKAPADYQWPA